MNCSLLIFAGTKDVISGYYDTTIQDSNGTFSSSGSGSGSGSGPGSGSDVLILQPISNQNDDLISKAQILSSSLYVMHLMAVATLGGRAIASPTF